MKNVKIKTTFEKIKNVVGEFDKRNLKDMLTFTGSKANYLGGGWWLIGGYSQDGKDVDRVIEKL